MITDSMSLGEKLLNSLGVTLLGIGIVFIVLMLISFLIDLMHKALGEKSETTSNSLQTESGIATTSALIEEGGVENLQRDDELIAVITAAIAAASNKY